MGPKGWALRATADRSLKEAVGSLERSEKDSPLGAYTQKLTQAQGLLRCAIRADVVDGRAMRALSMTQLELETVQEPSRPVGYADLLEIAQQSRPRDGAFQIDIASTYLRIGDVDVASPILRSVVAAKPALGQRAVAALDEAGVDPREIARTLGDAPEVLYALEGPFTAHGMTDAFIDELGRSVSAAPGAVIDFYGDVCERNGQWSRALATLGSMTPLRNPVADAARLAVIARADLALGNPEEAERHAYDAVQASPQNARYKELLADCSARLGRDDAAIDALTKSLSTALATGTSAGQRGRLYRKLGEVYERKGEGDRAYDAYRRALELVPGDPIATQRLSHITNEKVPQQ